MLNVAALATLLGSMSPMHTANTEAANTEAANTEAANADAARAAAANADAMNVDPGGGRDGQRPGTGCDRCRLTTENAGKPRRFRLQTLAAASVAVLLLISVCCSASHSRSFTPSLSGA